MSQKQSTERVGDGTPGKRVKAAWRRAHSNMSLKAWVRTLAVLDDGNELKADATRWTVSKRSGGSDAQRRERASRIRERRSINSAARASRRGKQANKQQQKKGGSNDPR